MENLIDDDGFTEVRNANIPRVDLVDKAANGTPFLLMKSADDDDTSPNLLSSEMVEQLLKQAEEPNMTDAAPVTIVKADEEDLLVTTGVGPLDATTPGSEGWETIDAQTAEEVYAQIVRLQNTLELLSAREEIEAMSGDPDDAESAWSLQDAASALDYAGDVVAVYAAGENAEAQAEADSVAKALAEIPAGAITTVESFGSIKKAGRTLSAANESKLRSASESIQSVLSSLPAAPDDVTKKGATVSETETTAEPIIKADDPAAPTDAPAAKQAVFDAAGKLVGIVDPKAIEPITGATADDSTPDDSPDADAVPAEPAAPAAPVAPVAKATEDDPKDAPLSKSAVEEIVKGALREARAEDAVLVKSLQDEIEHLKAPARSKVHTNGADGTIAVSREGQVVKSEGSKTADELRKASLDAPDAYSKKKIDDERQQRAYELLQSQLHPSL